MVLNSTPRTWTDGEVPTALMLNTELRDAIKALQAVWDTYSPTWSAATTNPAIGNGSIVGRYMRIGKTVDVLVLVTFGSTTTLGSGNWALSLPVSAKTGIGSTLLMAASSSASVNGFMGYTSPLNGSTTGNIWYPSQGTTGDWNVMSNSAPTGWSSGDTIRVFGRYEAA